MKIIPLLALILLAACGNDQSSDSVFIPQPAGNQGNFRSWPGSGALGADLRLTLKSGNSSPMPSLSSTGDGTTTDSLNLYLDVDIANIGPEAIAIPPSGESLSLEVRISLVDVPYKKLFDRGKLKISVGWTETGLQASDSLDFPFSADTSMLFSIPLSRADSFHIADNVAVYGEALAQDRFLIANRVLRFLGSTPPETDPAPDLVGYVRSVDPSNRRLYVSDAIVALNDSTLVESPTGEVINLESLKTGENALTITALAWAYDLSGAMIANGWEFKHFTVYIAREIILPPE